MILESNENLDKKYKLFYFDYNNKAAIIRAILTYVKADWEDKKIEPEEWKKISNEFEFKFLPVLEDENGNRFSHSIAIEILLAKKFNLFFSGGKEEDEEEYEIVSLLDLKNDLTAKFLLVINPIKPEDLENQNQNLDDLLTNIFPFYLSRFEKRIIMKKTFPEQIYFTHNKFTLIDLIYTVFIYNIFKHPLRKDLLEPILIKNAPNLNKLVDHVYNNELKEYFKNVYLLDKVF